MNEETLVAAYGLSPDRRLIAELADIEAVKSEAARAERERLLDLMKQMFPVSDVDALEARLDEEKAGK